MRWRKKVCLTWKAESGQSSVEYALILVAFLALILAFAALWRFLEAGSLIEHALMSASHHLSGGVGVYADIWAY